MNAFITGSHAYGTPRADSDVDLVVLTDTATKEKLAKLLAEYAPKPTDDYPPDGARFAIGKLNLLVFDDRLEFGVWRNATAMLQQQAPVTRAQACAAIEKDLAEVGL